MEEEEGYNRSELGNWNSAREFSRVKIMDCLAKCEVYENIAEFGYDTLTEEMMNYGIPIDNLKLMGFKRLVKELIKVIKNSKFALKKKGTKEKAEQYERQLIVILEKIYPTLFEPISNQRTGSRRIQINQVRYDITLKTVLDIKSNINTPLNQNNLIFNDREEFDASAYKEKVFKMATQRG